VKAALDERQRDAPKPKIRTIRPKPVVQTEPPRDGLAKVAEAAKLMNMSRDFVYDLIEKGQIEHVAINGNIRIPWKEVHALVASGTHRRQSSSSTTKKKGKR
jgi:excisionase family DNA binding protein